MTFCGNIIRNEVSTILNAGSVIKILVNNVGTSNNYPKSLQEHNENEVSQLININLGFACQLSREILPHLLYSSRGNHGRSGVVFISSMAGILPGAPFIPIYAACKAALISLSNSIKAENSDKNLDVLCVVPGHVNAGKTPAWFGKGTTCSGIASAKEIARLTMGSIGASNTTICPYMYHSIQLAFLHHLIPTRVILWIERNMLKGVRTTT